MRRWITRWPGKGWIAHRSQQGLHGNALVLGPLQAIKSGTNILVYVTWPVPFLIASPNN